MIEEIKAPESDKSAPDGRVHPLVSLWLRLLEWLGMRLFALSQWCEHQTIGKKVLTAYRMRSPDALAIVMDRYEKLNAISPNFAALDTLGSMYRQMKREKANVSDQEREQKTL
jgi:hypothetical protein